MFDSLVSWESRKRSGVEGDASRHKGKGWRAGGTRSAVERRICQAHKGIIPWGSDESGVNEERSREGGGEAEKRMIASLVAKGAEFMNAGFPRSLLGRTGLGRREAQSMKVSSIEEL